MTRAAKKILANIRHYEFMWVTATSLEPIDFIDMRNRSQFNSNLQKCNDAAVRANVFRSFAHFSWQDYHSSLPDGERSPGREFIDQYALTLPPPGKVRSERAVEKLYP